MGIKKYKKNFRVRELTGDEIPEIYINAPGPHSGVWSVENGSVVKIEWLHTYDRLLTNGGLFYHRPGLGRDDYSYQGFSPESKEIPDLYFQVYYKEIDGEPGEVYFIQGEEVTQENWREVTDVYFALYNEEPDEEYPTFSEWVGSLGITIEPLPLSIEKARRIYRAFWANKISGYDFEDKTLLAILWYGEDVDFSDIFVWDFTGDGIPELYLPEYNQDVWTIRDGCVVLLGSIDDMEQKPKDIITYREWQNPFNYILRTIYGNKNNIVRKAK